jgi:hypothetical protein
MPPLVSASISATATPASAVVAVAATAFFGRTCAPPRATPLEAARECPPAPRLATVPRPGDGRGGEATLAATRTLPADAAVGLLSRERSTLRGTFCGGGGGAALRALASEAAVGANRPDVGREGREAATDDAPPATAAPFFNDGVFGREPGVADGVRDLAALLWAAVERGSVDGALQIPPFDGVRGVGVLERVARVAVAVDGRAPGDDVDFEGDAGVLVVGFGGAVDGRDIEVDARSLIAGVAVVAGVGTGAGGGGSCTMAGLSSSTVGGIVLGAAADSDVGRSDVGTCSDGVPSSAAGGTIVVVAVVRVVPRNVTDGVGGLELVRVPLVALPFVLTGGHSRAIRCSSFTASPALLEVALVARDGGPPDALGWRFCCCSKRPMRFATD